VTQPSVLAAAAPSTTNHSFLKWKAFTPFHDIYIAGMVLMFLGYYKCIKDAGK
jgi:hypothetical protein